MRIGCFSLVFIITDQTKWAEVIHRKNIWQILGFYFYCCCFSVLNRVCRSNSVWLWSSRTVLWTTTLHLTRWWWVLTCVPLIPPHSVVQSAHHVSVQSAVDLRWFVQQWATCRKLRTAFVLTFLFNTRIFHKEAGSDFLPRPRPVCLCLCCSPLSSSAAAGFLCVIDVFKKFKPTRFLLQTGSGLNPAGSGI